MSVPLYMDHHVKSAITVGLRARGLDVLTAQEDDAADWADERLLERATELGRVFFTQDRDLLEIAKRWVVEQREFAGVVYGHQWKITVGQAIADLQYIAEAAVPEDMKNNVEFLPLK